MYTTCKLPVLSITEVINIKILKKEQNYKFSGDPGWQL